MALFQQWKGLDFPVLMDPLNLLGVKAVPITLLVDEGGTIRYYNPKPKDLDTFLATDYPAPKKKREKPTFHPLTEEMSEALIAKHSRQAQQALLLYQEVTKTEKLEPALSFQAGVLARWLYDEGEGADFFQTAVSYWQDALAETPSQYIWRRRIQQFGPRLDKPYPFYNWVETARKEVTARGEKPVSLKVEPSGSEVAGPLRRKKSVVNDKLYPDLQNKLPNEENLLETTTTLIPHTDRKDIQRVHLLLSPRENAHWSSDAQELELWLISKNGKHYYVESEASLIPADEETSRESRRLEAEVMPSRLKDGKLVLFYSLCEKENGVCRFLKSELD